MGRQDTADAGVHHLYYTSDVHPDLVDDAT